MLRSLVGRSLIQRTTRKILADKIGRLRKATGTRFEATQDSVGVANAANKLPVILYLETE